jgi:hypothetical protein
VSCIFYGTFELLGTTGMGPSRIQEGHEVVHEDH